VAAGSMLLASRALPTHTLEGPFVRMKETTFKLRSAILSRLVNLEKNYLYL
jgi:hypothetical protein